VRGGFLDLEGDARAEAGWRDEHPGPLIERNEVFAPAEELDALCAELQDFLRLVDARHHEIDRSQPCPNQGPDLLDEPNEGVGVGASLVHGPDE